MADDASSLTQTRRLANAIRALTMDAVEQAKSGHPGMPLGMADAATVLFSKFLKFDPSMPDWPDRDRFVLSAGHGSMLLYALLHLTGYADVTLGEIKRFRQLGSTTPGHPEYGHTSGVETTTGPLGQGLANAVGMAIAEAHLRAQFGELVDHRTYVIVGDGCLMEGVSQEALTLAGRLKLNRLIVLWDDNGITIDGALSLSDVTDQRARFAASGWDTVACDGHDGRDVERALSEAQRSDKPVLIAVKTTIGYGAPSVEGTKNAHSNPLGGAEIAAARARLSWTAAPFEIPADVADQWKAIGERGRPVREAWQQRLARSRRRRAFEAAMNGALPKKARAALTALARAQGQSKAALATRAASGAALEAIAPFAPPLLGGSADLTGSNNTLVKGAGAFTDQDRAGSYLYYGVREHAMAGAMNGLALHGGVIPYGGTFLCFADYARPAIRLSALMGVRALYVMTHDSIGVGEDGPTHQPVEHLASLRAIPNLYVFRPADAVETAEAWDAALGLLNAPSVLALSRQIAPNVRAPSRRNLVARGAYELRPPEGRAQVSLFATGTEVALAVAAWERLREKGVSARVVSCPCFELFNAQEEAYRRRTIGSAKLRIAIEAGVRQSWDAFLRPQDAFIGMTRGFGASAPADELYKFFGITVEAALAAVEARL